MDLIAYLCTFAALLGVVEACAGVVVLRRFRRRRASPPAALPPVTILKPLKGGEPMLEEALASFLDQDYPEFQVVFAAADPADEALLLAHRVAERFAGRDVAFVAGHDCGAANRKVANLIAMWPHARHDIVVIADQDVHAPAGMLRALVGALEEAGVGLVSAPYTAVVGTPGLVGALGASRITHDFLPAALLGRALGRADTFGATMATRREVITRMGGFEAIADELADDAVLGRRAKALGLRVVLAPLLVATTVTEGRFGALFRHELRWARTVRSLAPLGFALSALNYPLAFALAAAVLSRAAPWALGVFGMVLVARVLLARALERILGNERPILPAWAFPLRDILSLTELLVSYAGNRVEWRGAVLRAGRPGSGTCAPVSQRGFLNR